MKILLILCLIFLDYWHCKSQSGNGSVVVAFSDSSSGTSTDSKFKGNKPDYWHTVSRENIVFKSHGLIRAIDQKIITLENLECEALKKRDSIALIGLWEKDFTLEESYDPLVTNRSGLPYYMTLWRTIEIITQVDSTTVYASGTEVSRIINAQLRVEQPMTKKFFHIWKMEGWVWKLNTKRTY